jgi:hypothetical protein
MLKIFGVFHLVFKYLFIAGLYSIAFSIVNFAYQGFMEGPVDTLPLGMTSQYCGDKDKWRNNKSCVDFDVYQSTVKRWIKTREAKAKNRQAADRFLRAMVKQNHPSAYADLSACILSQLCSDDAIGLRGLEAEYLLDAGLAKHPDNAYLRDRSNQFNSDTSLIIAVWFTRIQKRIDAVVDAIPIPGIS